MKKQYFLLIVLAIIVPLYGMEKLSPQEREQLEGHVVAIRRLFAQGPTECCGEETLQQLVTKEFSQAQDILHRYEIAPACKANEQWPHIVWHWVEGVERQLYPALQVELSSARACSIEGLDKKRLLYALWQRAGIDDSSMERAVKSTYCSSAPLSNYFEGMCLWLNEQGFNEEVRYIAARQLRVDISGDTLYTGAFNNMYGKGAAEHVVARLRNSVG